MENKYKLKLCDFYIKGKCNNKDKCTYAHGEKELICVFDEKCINDKCDRIHINRDKNINDKIYIKEKGNKEIFKKVDIFDEKEFPTFDNKISSKKDITSITNITYDLKNILNIKDECKNKNKNEIINNESKYIEKRINELDIELSKLNKDDWSYSIEIEEKEKEKEELEFNLQKINLVNRENKINNIIDENTENDIEDIKLPSITLTIKENDNQNDEVMEIIDKMYNEILKLNINLKQNIKKDIKYDYFKSILISDLNKIQANIKLFKDNYEDCLK